MAGSNAFSVVFNSDILTVKDVVNEALLYLRISFPDISKDQFFELKLLISELLLNAVTHGNNSDATKKVSFMMNVVGDDSVLIKVSDEGDGFDISGYLKESEHEGKLFDESGRGIKIVNSLADEISISGLGNEIKIYKKVMRNE